MNISLKFPSSETGYVVDVQKGRAIIPLTTRELKFLADFYALLTFNGAANPSANVSGDPENFPVAVAENA